jgi:hypothetical protein
LFAKKILWRVIPWNSWLHHKVRKLRRRRTPEGRKQNLILRLAKEHALHVFIETGTFLGDMIDGVEKQFDEVHSIELSEELYQMVKKRFKNKQKIHLYQGDSGRILSEIVQKMDRPALIWLDAHFIPDMPLWKKLPVAKPDPPTPILSELEAIRSSSMKLRHLVLVDDASSFTGRDGWPSLMELTKSPQIRENVLILP